MGLILPIQCNPMGEDKKRNYIYNNIFIKLALRGINMGVGRASQDPQIALRKGEPYLT